MHFLLVLGATLFACVFAWNAIGEIWYTEVGNRVITGMMKFFGAIFGVVWFVIFWAIIGWVTGW